MPKYYVNATPDAIYWYKDAKMELLHRVGGPAIEHANHARAWYQNGKLHREGGPALEHANGDRGWYRNGKLHRDDGPAIEWSGSGKEWYLNGKQLTEDEFIRATQPVVELTVAEIERMVGKRVKIVK